MSFSDRLTQLIDNQYNGNKKKFSESTRIAYTSVVEYTKGVKKDPKLSLINKIQDSNINVNALWLLTGRGSMLLEEGGDNAVAGSVYKEGEEIKERLISQLEGENRRLIASEARLVAENTKLKKENTSLRQENKELIEKKQSYEVKVKPKNTQGLTA